MRGTENVKLVPVRLSAVKQLPAFENVTALDKNLKSVFTISNFKYCFHT
jgi:hypothetical protein